MLTLSNISQTYKQGNESIKVLDNLSLKLKNNCNVGLFGPSGSGKSTLLNLIGLLESPTLGKIKINNLDCEKFNLEEKTYFRRNYIGFIFQNIKVMMENIPKIRMYNMKFLIIF